ncbi:MAG: Nre family DNA repair protein [Candidatus Bathyarchaeota archaeon]|nr:Nre family DNA repair protein [Candidatus Bathyarchaeota archaeon]
MFEEVVGKIKNLKIVNSSNSLCLPCKAGRMLCGKPYCPILLKLDVLKGHGNILDLDFIEGSTPPAAFVGHQGYPKIQVGPLIPPFHGDTSTLDLPESWVGKSLRDILDLRFSLVWGKFKVKVDAARKGLKFIEMLHDAALSSKSVDGEAFFAKKPSAPIVLDDWSQPFGISAPILKFKITGGVGERKLERCFYDHDLKAEEAVLKLYSEGVPVSRIQHLLSLGMLGVFKDRVLVPTRWSITAVDSTISLNLIEEIKHYESIGEYRLYFFKNLDNLFIIILIPGKWSFEWIEAWFPGTVWNASGLKPEIMGDFEGFKGRKSYATVGGCYYAARLAVAEALKHEKKQASALLLREIYSGYTIPVGVWNVRESVRWALKTKPNVYQTFPDLLKGASTILRIPIVEWFRHSKLLKNLILQKRIPEFLSEKA